MNTTDKQVATDLCKTIAELVNENDYNGAHDAISGLHALLPRKTIAVRHKTREGCEYCERHSKDSMMPFHDPSPRCKSGGYAHCTCDTCF